MLLMFESEPPPRPNPPGADPQRGAFRAAKTLPAPPRLLGALPRKARRAGVRGQLRAHKRAAPGKPACGGPVITFVMIKKDIEHWAHVQSFRVGAHSFFMDVPAFSLIIIHPRAEKQATRPSSCLQATACLVGPFAAAFYRLAHPVAHRPHAPRDALLSRRRRQGPERWHLHPTPRPSREERPARARGACA